MIDALRGWLLSILLLCVFCALAESLMPSGAVKQVGKLVCGLVLLCGMISPLLSLDVESGQYWVEEQLKRWNGETDLLKQAAEDISKPIIEEGYAAYIVDKAAEQGIFCSARVHSKRDDVSGVSLPWEIWVFGEISEANELWLQKKIAQDLAIPVQRQHYGTWEEGP